MGERCLCLGDLGLCYCLVAKCIQFFCNPMDCSCQTPLSMGFFKQEYLHMLLFPSPGDLPNPGIEPTFPALAGKFFTIETPGKAPKDVVVFTLPTLGLDASRRIFPSPLLWIYKMSPVIKLLLQTYQIFIHCLKKKKEF